MFVRVLIMDPFKEKPVEWPHKVFESQTVNFAA